LTATSADDCRCGRIIGGVVGGAEGVAQGFDGLALEAEPYVGLDAGGDADVGVTEEFLDHDEVDALLRSNVAVEWRRSWMRMRPSSARS
jgi:hypothetical protein